MIVNGKYGTFLAVAVVTEGTTVKVLPVQVWIITVVPAHNRTEWRLN